MCLVSGTLLPNELDFEESNDLLLKLVVTLRKIKSVQLEQFRTKGVTSST